MSTFTKRRPAAPPGFFAVEAAGLAWLAVPGGAEVAEVITVGSDCLTVSHIDSSPPSAVAAREFGRRLAHTHDAGATAFGVGPDGWTGDGFIGDAPLSLRSHPRWGAFYAAERVLPYALAAHRSGSLSAAGLSIIEATCGHLDAGEFDDDAPPARLHGDLWAGNVLFTPDAAAVIDPAAHGGHRVTDLAMLALFGLPFLEQVFAGYAEWSTTLRSDWRGLIALHQLHPLLVHAVLFGGGYAERAVQVARRS